MPDRIVRVGILSSECLTPLSWGAEVFFRRLMSVVDDFGRYDGRPPILRAQLYPLKLDRVSEADIEGWVLECEKSEVLMSYVVAGKPYLEIKKFGQRLRAMRSKWPEPVQRSPSLAGKCPQLSASAVICGQMRPETESELESESETYSESKTDAERETETKVNTRPSLPPVQACEVILSREAPVGRVIPGAETYPSTSTTPEIPTLEQVKAFAALPTSAIPPEVAVDYFDKSEAVGWVDHLSRPIRNWKADLKTYHRAKSASLMRREQGPRGAPDFRSTPAEPVGLKLPTPNHLPVPRTKPLVF